MVTDEEESEQIQNIQIVTDAMDMTSLPPGTRLVLLDAQNSTDTVAMLNPETGQQMEVLQSNMEAPMIIESIEFDTDIHSIVPEVADHVETVGMDFNQIEAVAMVPDGAAVAEPEIHIDTVV